MKIGLNMGRLEIYKKVKIWMEQVREKGLTWSTINKEIKKVYILNQIVDSAVENEVKYSVDEELLKATSL